MGISGFEFGLSLAYTRCVGKKNKKRKSFPLNPFSLLGRFHISLPERARSMTLSVFMFALAFIFSFAFIEKAGSAGKILFQGAEFLVGGGVFSLPLVFVIAGLVFWRMKKYNALLVFFTLLLLIVGISGALGSFSRWKGLDVNEIAGWLGFMASWPVFQAFGFWVAEIIFGAVIAVAVVIFWQLVPHEKIEKPRFAEGAQEKLKKIFEPKFRVEDVDPESKDEEESDEEEDSPAGEKNEGKKRGLLFAAKKKPKQAVSLSRDEDYKFPPIDILDVEKGAPNAGDVKAYTAIIKKTLANFDIPVEIPEVNIGPAVTQYAFKPAEGVKLSRITALQNDLSLALAAHPLRIEAPIPGRALMGIEIPNKVRATVRLRNLIADDQFAESQAALLIALGKDVSGSPMYADLAKMPHLLVAGATGTGKTIGLNNIIVSLVYRNSPAKLRFILVDPKRVEFPVYENLPHLLCSVIFDTQRAVNALKWLVKEMERRFQVLAQARVRDISSYHTRFEEYKTKGGGEESEEMPYIIMVIDELADLMASRGKDMEAMVVRLAQMARAVGIHLVLATQRPSVEVLTGLIKANITSRIAFQVASQIDSRTILDGAGAEKLLGRGDMLFISSEFQKPRRIQGSFLSDKEVARVVEWIAKETKEVEKEEFGESNLAQSVLETLEGGELDDGDDDPLYDEAKRVVLESRKASASYLQRRLKIGYARAARLLDILENKGIVGPGEGAKPREVYAASGQEQGEEEDEWRTP